MAPPRSNPPTTNSQPLDINPLFQTPARRNSHHPSRFNDFPLFNSKISTPPFPPPFHFMEDWIQLLVRNDDDEEGNEA